MIELEIDGQTVQASEGMTVIQAADEAGIYIPRFCYHEKLSIAANCRQCLVDIEKAPKTLPACATLVTPGMKVKTQSKAAIKSQSTVMQFLLINHPLDCPICDQGGECELQDLAMGYGQTVSSYAESKRAVVDHDVGPLITTCMTRCIHCTRCVRFGEEIAGLPEMGATGRGEQMEIGTYVKHFLRSELSGNIIDLCPVGALTSKPFRFHARAWEMQTTPSVAPHDCLGSFIQIHTRKQDDRPQRALMRVLPRCNNAVNENWLSDRDRFSYEGMKSERRLKAPRMKVKGVWKTVDWPTALHAVAQRCKKVCEAQGADALAAVASASSTVESLYMLQKCLRALGSPHVESRLRTSDFRDQDAMPRVPGMAMSMEALEQCDQVLLVGANVSEDQPLWAHRLRQSVMDDEMQVHSIGMRAYPYHFHAAHQVTPDAGDLLRVLVDVASFVCAQRSVDAPALPEHVPHAQAQAIAEALLQAEKPVLVLGLDAMRHPDAAPLRAWLQLLADALGAEQIYLTEGANTAGAAVAGMLPHRGPWGASVDQQGYATHALWQKHRGVFFLMDTEPELDAAEAHAALQALKEAEYVVCLNPFMSEAMEAYADVVLPITPISETDGSFINVLGHWSCFSAASMPHANSKPAWKILRVLASLLGVEGMDYASVEAIRDAMGYEAVVSVQAGVEGSTALAPEAPEPGVWVRDGAWSRYAVDATLRHAPALQARLVSESAQDVVWLHPDAAASLNLKEGDALACTQEGVTLKLPVAFDTKMPLASVRLPAGRALTAGFGRIHAPITVG